MQNDGGCGGVPVVAPLETQLYWDTTLSLFSLYHCLPPLPPPFPPGTFPVLMVSYQLILCLQLNGLIFLEKTHKLSRVLSPLYDHPETPSVTQDSSTV